MRHWITIAESLSPKLAEHRPRVFVTDIAWPNGADLPTEDHFDANVDEIEYEDDVENQILHTLKTRYGVYPLHFDFHIGHRPVTE